MLAFMGLQATTSSLKLLLDPLVMHTSHLGAYLSTHCEQCRPNRQKSFVLAGTAFVLFKGIVEEVVVDVKPKLCWQREQRRISM